MGHIIIIIIICLQFEVLYVAQIDLKPRFNCIFFEGGFRNYNNWYWDSMQCFDTLQF